MLRLSLLLLALATPLWAAPARVISGEHDGFTRLVVELADPAAWSVGRSADGYELRIAGAKPDYDLSVAFAVIGRSRIAALSVDAATGGLQAAVGCLCHVSAFEFRPGTLVLDFKDGPPPPESPFEVALPDASPQTESAPVPEADPANGRAFAEHWVDHALGVAPSPAPPPSLAAAERTVANPPAQQPDPALAPLRDDILREISRGVAQGIVTVDLPEMMEPAEPEAPDQATDQTRLGFGQLDMLAQVTVGGPGREGADLSAEGMTCPTDVQLDLAAWGDDRPVWEQISTARSGLTGEFDRLDPAAVSRAVRFHLFIGFGQEALTLLQALGSDDVDAALWRSLAHLVDGREDPQPTFADMGLCDSTAALWALLSAPVGQKIKVNMTAVQRGFSALPSGLRQNLGPGLIERLMAMGEIDAVDVVTNAIARSGGEADRGVVLISAEVAAQAGDFDAADRLLEPLLQDAGPQTAEALVARIETMAARALPLPPSTLPEIEAYAAERAGGPDADRFLRAKSLALALTGDFARAFAGAPQAEAMQQDLWRLLAALGTDDAVLAHAAVLPGDGPPAAGMAEAVIFAERFLQLGLPDQAQIWLAGVREADPLLAARIALANRDGMAVLAHLRGVNGSEADQMRIAAHILTGDNRSAATDLGRLGEAQAASAALARAGDWDALRQGGMPEWQVAALAALPQTALVPTAPLAEGMALADQAKNTSSALRALLASLPAVEETSP